MEYLWIAAGIFILFLVHKLILAPMRHLVVNVVVGLIVFGALVGAITWNVVTWYYGIPSSSSHALIGGIVGAAIAKAGTDPLIGAGIMKTVAFIGFSDAYGEGW